MSKIVLKTVILQRWTKRNRSSPVLRNFIKGSPFLIGKSALESVQATALRGEKSPVFNNLIKNRVSSQCLEF